MIETNVKENVENMRNKGNKHTHFYKGLLCKELEVEDSQRIKQL